jgi:putative endonuclease
MNKGIYTNPWFVYILECCDKTLYVGITTDINRRLKEHNNTKKCRYTRSRQPVSLVHFEKYENHELAIKREIQIKSFTRKKKQNLIKNR